MKEKSEDQKLEVVEKKASLTGELLSEETIAEIQSTSPQLVEKIEKDLHKSIEVTYCEQQHISSGPIPSPDMLREYELVFPGLAKRIIDGAEQERNHRHSTQTSIIDKEYSERKTGQVLGFLIGIAALGVCLCLGLYGQTVVASIVGGTSIVGLVSVFIIGKKMEIKKSKEESESDEDKANLDI